MLYQKDPKYAHLPHSEWLKTPDGERWRQASQKWSQEFSAPAAGPVRGGRPEDRIRDLMGRPGRRPVSDGKGPPPGKPPKPEPPKSQCYPQCEPDGSISPVQNRMCMRTPDPKCRPSGAPVALAPALPPAPDLAQWLEKTKPGWSAGMTQYQR